MLYRPPALRPGRAWLAVRLAKPAKQGQASLLIAACLAFALAGCRSERVSFNGDAQLKHYQLAAQMAATPACAYDESPSSNTLDACTHPFSLRDPSDQIEYWDLGLQETINLTLVNAKVLRNLQGRAITAPASEATIFEPAIASTNPVFGPQAALAAFDTQWQTAVLFGQSDRPLNSRFSATPPGFSNSETASLQTSLSKVGAAGTQMSLTGTTTYANDRTNSSFFRSSYFQTVEANLVQPLFQGRGLEINRIAGPSARPGFFFGNGVLLAKNNVDISIADFEQGVTTLLSDLEDAYWDLNFAYRNLQSQIAARDAALATWRRVHALYEAGRRGGEAENEAQARQQLLSFEAAVQNALAGSPTQPGVYTAERRLRRLMGLPPNDGRLIRPMDDPTAAPMVYDWSQMLPEALMARVEARRQKLQIRRREMELVAAKNFILPRIDAVGGYRALGFGDDWMGAGSAGSAPYGSATNNLFRGDFQEWNVGVNANISLGFRTALSNLRHTQLNLTRERAVLREQENQIAHSLSDSVAEMQRAYALSKTFHEQRIAATEQEEFVRRAYEAQRVTIDVLVTAQRARAQAETAYFGALTEYAKAIKNVQVAKGGLLPFNQVMLSEGPWPRQAYRDARELDRRFQLNYSLGDRSRWTNPNGAPRPVLGRVEFPESLQPGVAGAEESAPLQTLEPEPVNAVPNSATLPPKPVLGWNGEGGGPAPQRPPGGVNAPFPLPPQMAQGNPPTGLEKRLTPHEAWPLPAVVPAVPSVAGRPETLTRPPEGPKLLR